ncbi:Eukaryotic translation initiation factor 2D [Pseudolycoriella hygida]|uniref:Eukaryotic translation initiation factor 2D n=1 Tax=Pseudolycoriella hygida TaxID=35572 RepID=A0A9Q0S6L7_9DIPT|nr:Eukaryotic translation initiation factor 2D [Pseudolycoriella hygida]
MFVKAVKTKSNIQLKSSERKKLQLKVSTKFNVTPDELNTLFPNKSSISFIKLITHNDEIVSVYAVDKRPLFFETPDQNFLPTVYTLWLVPSLLPAFTTHPAVLPRLANGADLMLPGIIRQGQGPRSYGYYKKHEIVAVNLTSNKAAIAVGLLAKSSDDLYMSGGVGIGVNVLHVFGDKLWGLDASVTLQVPFLGVGVEMPTEEDFPALGGSKSKEPTLTATQQVVQKSMVNSVNAEEFPMLGADTKRKLKPTTEAETVAVTEQFSDLLVDEVKDENPSDPQDDDEEFSAEEEVIEGINHDELLRTAFFTALKRDGKSLALPLLTSTFYRCHVLPASDQPIDLKKTSHKKLSKFLQEMEENRFIALKEEQKGVEKITQVNLGHPELVDFIPKPIVKDDNAEKKNNLFETEMTELYLVTDETAKFFASFNVGNGDGLPSSQIKKMLKEYVCNNKLQSPLNPRIIQVNETLCVMCNRTPNTSIPFEELLAILLSKMTHSFEMRSKNETKSKNQTIQMSLATRSGNKKVTLVSNLEAYGIRLSEFEKACKLGVAASTTVTKLPYQKGEQLLVQGNQIRFIYKLLTETYKIPGKNIVGLDLAKKEKKVKK